MPRHPSTYPLCTADMSVEQGLIGVQIMQGLLVPIVIVIMIEDLIPDGCVHLAYLDPYL
jgi:hypothetical protein